MPSEGWEKSPPLSANTHGQWKSYARVCVCVFPDTLWLSPSCYLYPWISTHRKRITHVWNKEKFRELFSLSITKASLLFCSTHHSMNHDGLFSPVVDTAHTELFLFIYFAFCDLGGYLVPLFTLMKILFVNSQSKEQRAFFWTVCVWGGGMVSGGVSVVDDEKQPFCLQRQTLLFGGHPGESTFILPKVCS